MTLILSDNEIREAIEQYVRTNVSNGELKELNCKRGGKVEAVVEIVKTSNEESEETENTLA